MIDVYINDERHALPEGTTLAEVVAQFATAVATVAAVNETFVPRGSHASRVLAAGDRVELLAPMEGG